MRESRSKDRTRLPAGSTELWLGVQKPPKGYKSRHRNPPEDSFEAWIKQQVEGALRKREVVS